MPGGDSTGLPTVAQLLSGNDRLVVDTTVKAARGVLVKVNWKTPLACICKPVKVGGVPITPWIMGMVWPSKLIFAVRAGPVLAVKEKLTMPLVTESIVSHDCELTGANGGGKFCVAGITAGNASLPADILSSLGVGSTKAWGSSLIALWPESAM